MKTGTARIALFVAILGVYCSSAMAALELQDGSATGQWFNAQRAGEGIYVEIVEANPKNLFWIAWFTFDLEGNQMWLIGDTEVDPGQTSVTMDLQVFDGPVFGPGYDPNDLNETRWGSITMEFTECNRANVAYSSVLGFGSGEISMVRLTNIEQVDCIESPPTLPPIGTLTTGNWVDGAGTFCLNVGDDGQSITDQATAAGPSCTPNDHALYGLLNGVDDQGAACTAEVLCEGEWTISNVGLMECSFNNTLAIAIFSGTSQVSGTARTTSESGSCTANFTASPAQ